MMYVRKSCRFPGGRLIAVSLRARINKWYEWNPMPRAPPINNSEMVVVPSVSNLAKPYGYFSEGGLRDRRQQNRVTKSPSKSEVRLLVSSRTMI